MTTPQQISISDYNYELPESRIALRPLDKRDESKLLIYKNGDIIEDTFASIVHHLPENLLMVFNNSKVINARLRFEKSTGSKIEVFCLEPAGDINEYSTVMNQRGSSKWKCFIGGVAKWKEEFLIKELNDGINKIQLKAKIIGTLTNAYEVEFSWEPATMNFAEILDLAGDVPLPPYIKRLSENEDVSRYQTIYAESEGSVAAPTAGLHFTENIFSAFENKNIQKANVTLHVGAGTFKPVKAAVMKDHEMHTEWIDVDTTTIEKIMLQRDLVFAVGTTSLRTIETLYWLGVKSMLHPELEKLELHQWDVYDETMQQQQITIEDSLQALLKWMDNKKINRIFTQTQLLITPGYTFKIAKGLVTNFHQPQSTLLLLVAAAIGNDWKKCYQYALENDFRFLSYGDANLLFMVES
jgi:S-adenosylmethionine:tRNA ribosyltransferase-isomerase